MKILIVGIVASGKSTLARRLSSLYNIDCYEIDSIVHDDMNNRKRSNSEQQEIIREIDKNDSWIIEGTLRKNLDNLLLVTKQFYRHSIEHIQSFNSDSNVIGNTLCFLAFCIRENPESLER